jgi:hypothetical protein
VAATTLTGAGAGITALAAANITASGTLPALNGAALTALTAANITASGTLPALNGAALTALTAANITASGTLPALNGAALTALNGTQVTSGTVPVAQLGSSGTRSSSTFLNGANAWAAAGGAGLVLIGTAVASASADLTITGLDSTYDTYLIAISDINIASDGQNMNLRLGDSSGIDSGAGDYSYHTMHVDEDSTSYAAADSAGSAQILLCIDLGNAAAEGFGAVLWLHRPGDGTTHPIISGTVAHITTTNDIQGGFVVGRRESVIALDRVQLLTSSGNIDTGRMTIWGLAHA